MMELASNSFVAATDKITNVRWVSFGFRLLALVLGGLHTWAAVVSHSMNSDGIDYLDIGDAYMPGDWQTVQDNYSAEIVTQKYIHVFRQVANTRSLQ